VNGQWIAHYTGTNGGLLVVDLDDRGTFYQGSATLTDERHDMAPLFVAVRTPDKNPHQSLSLKVWPYVATQSPTYQQPAAAAFDARATFSLNGATLHVEADTSIQTRLVCDLQRALPEARNV
jgi:hypothetical protein